MGRCDRTIGGIRGENNIGGREGESGWQRPQDVWKKKRRQRGMQKGKEWIDEREGALMCFTFSFFFFFFAWMESVRRATVWCVRWRLVFREIMSMRGSQKKECEWGKILTPTMIHCGSQDHLSVNDKSQSSSYWQCWGTAVLCDYAGTCVEVNVGGGGRNTSMRACRYMYRTESRRSSWMVWQGQRHWSTSYDSTNDEE